MRLPFAEWLLPIRRLPNFAHAMTTEYRDAISAMLRGATMPDDGDYISPRRCSLRQYAATCELLSRAPCRMAFHFVTAATAIWRGCGGAIITFRRFRWARAHTICCYDGGDFDMTIGISGASLLSGDLRFIGRRLAA